MDAVSIPVTQLVVAGNARRLEAAADGRLITDSADGPARGRNIFRTRYALISQRAGAESVKTCCIRTT